MKYPLLAAALSLGMLASGQALAVNPQQLAKAKNCMSCHTVERKVVGPAFKDVAKRYAGQADAENKLTQKVLNGGAGAWGVVPMPANRAQVSEDEARQLVKWILTTK